MLGANRLNLFFALSIVMIACGLFCFKYKVADMNAEALKLEQEIVKTRNNIKILCAELKYLSNPERLQVLAFRHLKINQKTVGQLISIGDFKSNIINAKSNETAINHDELQGILVKIDQSSKKAQKHKIR